MLNKQTMQEIVDMKMRGYSIREIYEYYAGKPGKPPSIPTIRKYYAMDVVPADPGVNLVKDKVFDEEPWKSVIKKILQNNSGNCYSSSVYDVLIEHFIENGEYEKLPGEERTLRRYISHLVESGEIEKSPKDQRIYDSVFNTPPGMQMLIDFGEQSIHRGLTIHFICMLLRYSRMICVFAQDHKFNAEEACRAIYRGFCKLGGRPTELVIDQDSVFIASELYGEIVETHTFKAFTTEQELKLWVCNKNDPESKGPVENVVGFVKKNFFSARTITSIEDVWRSLPGWVERKNKRIHQATFMVPLEVFTEIECAALLPLMPSVYETLPTSFIETYVGDKKYITYKSSKYSVPTEFCFKTVYYKAVGDKLHIYGPDRKYECTHDLCPCKGGITKLPEHTKEEDSDWLKVVESLRSKWNCFKFQHFINGFKKENGRNVYKQLKAVERFLDSEGAPRDLVSEVMKECCQNFRYKFSQFKVVYERLRASSMPTPLLAPIPMDDVQHASLELYQMAFLERCNN